VKDLSNIRTEVVARQEIVDASEKFSLEDAIKNYIVAKQDVDVSQGYMNLYKDIIIHKMIRQGAGTLSHTDHDIDGQVVPTSRYIATQGDYRTTVNEVLSSTTSSKAVRSGLEVMLVQANNERSQARDDIQAARASAKVQTLEEVLRLLDDLKTYYTFFTVDVRAT
jgi:hypothetical protein